VVVGRGSVARPTRGEPDRSVLTMNSPINDCTFLSAAQPQRARRRTTTLLQPSTRRRPVRIRRLPRAIRPVVHHILCTGRLHPHGGETVSRIEAPGERS